MPEACEPKSGGPPSSPASIKVGNTLGPFGNLGSILSGPRRHVTPLCGTVDPVYAAEGGGKLVPVATVGTPWPSLARISFST